MGKPPKYQGKLEGLPKFVDPEDDNPVRRAKLEAEKEKLTDRRPTALGEQIIQIRFERDEAEKTLSEINLRYKAACELFETVCEAEKIKSVPFESGATVRVDHGPHAGFEKLWCIACDTAVQLGTEHECDMPCACKDCQGKVHGHVVSGHEAFRLYCIASGHENEMSLPWQTTNSLMGTAIADGEPLPPGLKPWNKPKFVITGLDKHPRQGKVAEPTQATIHGNEVIRMLDNL